MSAVSQAIEAVENKLPAIGRKLGEPMKNHTSFGIGGPVRAMFFPATAQEFSELFALLRKYGITPLIIGNGTNLLVEDPPLDIIAIKTAKLDGITHSGGSDIIAECGALLSGLAVFACGLGLSGLEFAHGIPGTLGGAVSMNAGAYGAEIKDVVIRTEAISPEQSVFTVSGEEHQFSYRKSRFSDGGHVILSSLLRLQAGDRISISAKMDELRSRRQNSQPLNQLSAGSTFKRPSRGYAAELIEKSGLKGFTIGRAQVSEKHAGFIINLGGASFSDVIAVIEHVQKTVLAAHGIDLEPEVKIVRRRDIAV